MEHRDTGPTKIVHLSVVRRLSAGQAKQLASEIEAARNIEGVEWATVALQSTVPEHSFAKRIPWPFRPMFLRNLYGWITAVRLSSRYDWLVMRHLTFDPFVFFFAPLIQNRISVHHSKEADELLLIAPGWRGRAASWFERFSGRAAVRSARMVAGVTPEIAEYQRTTHCPSKPTVLYANGVIPSKATILADRRNPDEIRIAFICGTFTSWQGLDKLMRAVESAPIGDYAPPLRVFLIGVLDEGQITAIGRSARLASVFVPCGLLSEADYRPILETCHIGLGSLALERANLSQAATLKVREMLSMGLPVYATHRDGSLPDHFPYYFCEDHVSLEGMVLFARTNSQTPRSHVAEAARPFISKLDQMRLFHQALKSFAIGGHLWVGQEKSC